MPGKYEFDKRFEPPINPNSREGKRLLFEARVYANSVIGPRNYEESTLARKGKLMARDVVVCQYADGGTASCWWVGCCERYSVRARTAQDAYELLLQQLYFRNISIDESRVVWLTNGARSNKYADL